MITDHHDGLGLNDRIEIEHDEPDPINGNASHRYTFKIDGKEVGSIQFQHGPRAEPTSTPGVTEAAVLAMLLHRLRGFQSGRFSCRENALVITKLEEALHWTEHRARDRAKRGVLGKLER